MFPTVEIRKILLSVTGLLAVFVSLPSVAQAQLQINVAGSSWDDQGLKTATIKVTGATPGNRVTIFIHNNQPLGTKGIRSAIANANGEVTLTIPTRRINPGQAATWDYAAGDIICGVEKVDPMVPPIPPPVARVKGQLTANGGIQNDGPCPMPALGVTTVCEDCDAVLANMPGLGRAGALLLMALLTAAGATMLRRSGSMVVHQTSETVN